ncbi:hypothetical protein FAP39_09980 [Shimia litoralis]|uniref:Uncharacterized protein n=1 Tax=Shimia litoralis TaxID=420403 RepID=A0A4U7N4R9_9RHOB|nr:hypothetical protein [Shimia litoralis]TKZ20608.1 hypothetical protein FAP39_09980 [Shimia litoralis]
MIELVEAYARLDVARELTFDETAKLAELQSSEIVRTIRASAEIGAAGRQKRKEYKERQAEKYAKSQRDAFGEETAAAEVDVDGLTIRDVGAPEMWVAAEGAGSASALSTAEEVPDLSISSDVAVEIEENFVTIRMTDGTVMRLRGNRADIFREKMADLTLEMPVVQMKALSDQTKLPVRTIESVIAALQAMRRQ